ncbi:MAG: hypothetical protein RLZZ618_3250 [Pseudomonadota bacterium]
MKKSLLALAAVATFSAVPTISFAEEVNPLSFNVSLTSDYRYRGISQSRLKPAVQGGVDYAFANGLYVGAWASYIKWIKDFGGGANFEVDLYGGWKGEVAKGLTLDFGLLTYQYPGHDLPSTHPLSPVNPNTLEIYGAATYGPATVKYSHSTTNLFGTANSKGSGYFEAAASFEVGGGVSLTPHVGYQRVAHNSDFSYTDFSLTASKDFSGFLVSGGVVATDTKDVGGYSYGSPANGKNLGRTGAVVSVKKTF